MKLTYLRKDIHKLMTVMLPILVAQLSTAGITFINTTMAGHAGSEDLAGVSVGAGLFYPILASIVGLLMAGTPLMAQLLGKKRRDELPGIVRTGLIIGLSIFALFTLSYFLGIDALLAHMALEAEVAYIARYYLMAMIGVVFFIALVIPLRCLTDTAGSTSLSMNLFLLAPPVNGIFNYLFIYGHLGLPAMGGIGTGIATMVTYGFLFFLFLTVVMKSRGLMGKEIFTSLSIRKADLKEYLMVGVPSGMSIFMEMSLFSVIILFLAKYGTDALAAYQIADNFASLVFMIPVSCSMALTILVATAAGAGDMELVHRYKKAGLVAALLGASMTAGLTILFNESIGKVYTGDADVIAIAGQFLIYSAGWQIFDAISTPIQGILRGLKDTRVSFVLMVIAYWGGCFPMSLFLDNEMAMGADSYWLGLVFGVGCSAFFMILRLIYVERVLDGKWVPDMAYILSFFGRERKAVRPVLSLATAESSRSMAETQRQLKDFLSFLAKMEKRTAALIQMINEAEIDIYIENRPVIPIRMAKLADLHRIIVGHATRAYVP